MATVVTIEEIMLATDCCDVTANVGERVEFVRVVRRADDLELPVERVAKAWGPALPRLEAIFRARAAAKGA